MTLLGITTEGAARSPAPLAEVFGGVRHQRWAFPMVADGVKAVLGAVASARKRRAAKQPPRPTGRASTPAAKQAARTQKRLDVQRAALVTPRYLCVQRHLRTTARKTLGHLTRGLPQCQKRRAIMAQVDALFARRCRTQTALDPRATLRRRVQRCKALGDTLTQRFSPTRENALTLLDDKGLPSTSHAVARGNRRSRKRQKHVYRVRTQAQIRARLALDMWREAQAEGRQHTLAFLHLARAG